MKCILMLVFMFGPMTILGQGVEKNLTNHPSSDRYASYSPNGENILFESNRSGDWEVFVMDKNGDNLLQLTTGGNNRRPSWHPIEEKILFEVERDSMQGLFELDFPSKRINLLCWAPIKTAYLFARYAPNGKSIALSHRLDDHKSQLLIMDNEGMVQDTLVSGVARTYFPGWSPEGASVVFHSRMDTNNEDDEIYTMHLPSRTLTRLTYWSRHNFCPSWAPSGQKIAYVTSIEGTRPEIYIMDRQGKAQQRVTFNQDGDTLPNWSPTTNELLITAYRQGNFEIVKISLE